MSPISSIANMFKKVSMSAISSVIHNLELIILDSDKLIPAELLAKCKVSNEIVITGANKKYHQISIDPEAFKSSQNLTCIFVLKSFDLTGVKFSFLSGFQHLKELAFLHISNIHSANWTTLPTLPSLKYLYIKYSTGLEHWITFPNLKYGLLGLLLVGNNMTDIEMFRTLEWAMESSANTLEILNIQSNAITRVPTQISSFKNLQSIYLDQNPFPPTIRSGSLDLVFSSLFSLKWFYLTSVGIENIESEVFQGIHLLFNSKVNFVKCR